MFLASDLGCAVFATFFYSLRSESKRIGSYSFRIRMFRYINKYHLFASVASYLLSNIRTDSKKYMLQRIFTSGQIFAQDFRILSNICFKIFVRSEYYQTFKRISHSSEHSLVSIRIQANIQYSLYVLFQIILESLSQILGLN